MKNLLFAVVVAPSALMTGCAGIPMPDYAAARAAAEALAGPTLPDKVCWLFGGHIYCPPADGSRLVLPCNSASCLSERPIPLVAIKPQVVPAPAPTIIAPTDASGKPARFANIVGAGYGGVVPTPYAIQNGVSYTLVTGVWVQPPVVDVPTVITVRPWRTMP